MAACVQSAFFLFDLRFINIRCTPNKLVTPLKKDTQIENRNLRSQGWQRLALHPWDSSAVSNQGASCQQMEMHLNLTLRYVSTKTKMSNSYDYHFISSEGGVVMMKCFGFRSVSKC